ncbi:hypothetical protein WMY93_031403 [Mugilogobius chulae]|uniref:Uncharacterized protein n=1 Tax=Mugilogobius chulae TaxID=88201 RepID=A0AAW0MDF7_9GOBI
MSIISTERNSHEKRDRRSRVMKTERDFQTQSWLRSTRFGLASPQPFPTENSRYSSLQNPQISQETHHQPHLQVELIDQRALYTELMLLIAIVDLPRSSSPNIEVMRGWKNAWS